MNQNCEMKEKKAILHIEIHTHALPTVTVSECKKRAEENSAHQLYNKRIKRNKNERSEKFFFTLLNRSE